MGREEDAARQTELPAKPGKQLSSLEELLQLYLWDLYAGCLLVERRLPAIAGRASDADWRTEVRALAETAGLRAQRMHAASAGGVEDGPDNLWMRGIMDDADRDTRNISVGPPLDLAMIGALRKAIAAELASIRTAKAIAVRLDADAALQALTLNEAQLRSADATLDQRLEALA